MNRPIHGFNESVERAVAKHVVVPASEAVESATPEGGGRTTGEAVYRARNALDNLGEPKNALNGALQGDIEAVGAAVARFGVNSTVGLLGTYDVAAGLGIEEQREDFGQTLGTWGAPAGPYMVAPLAGPTTARDATGSVVDSVLNPLSLISLPGEAVTVAKTGVRAADTVDDAKDTMAAPDLEDPYATERQQYEARRQAAIRNEDRLANARLVTIEHRQAAPTGYAGPAVYGPSGGMAPTQTASAAGAAAAFAGQPEGAQDAFDLPPMQPYSPPGDQENDSAGAASAIPPAPALRGPLVLDIYPESGDDAANGPADLTPSGQGAD